MGGDRVGDVAPDEPYEAAEERAGVGKAGDSNVGAEGLCLLNRGCSNSTASRSLEALRFRETLRRGAFLGDNVRGLRTISDSRETSPGMNAPEGCMYRWGSFLFRWSVRRASDLCNATPFVRPIITPGLPGGLAYILSNP
jgi:hypothetical protein